MINNCFRITHATPAASYAATPYRDWECDTKLPARTPDSFKVTVIPSYKLQDEWDTKQLSQTPDSFKLTVIPSYKHILLLASR